MSGSSCPVVVAILAAAGAATGKALVACTTSVSAKNLGRTRDRLTAFLDQRKPGTGPSLPEEGILRTQGRSSFATGRG